MFQRLEFEKPVIYNPERVKRQEQVDSLLMAAEQRIGRRAFGHHKLSTGNGLPQDIHYNVGVSAGIEGEEIDQGVFEDVFMVLQTAPVYEQRFHLADGYAAARRFWVRKLASGAVRSDLKKVAVNRLMMAGLTHDYWNSSPSIFNWKS